VAILLVTERYDSTKMVSAGFGWC